MLAKIQVLKETDEKYLANLHKSSVFKDKARINYGTSGFRFNNNCMDYIAFRTGIFVSGIALIDIPNAYGIVITASHNPVADNGVKIIDKSGNMLLNHYEKMIENFVNCFDLEEALLILTKELEQISYKKISISSDAGMILLGYDTRPSSVRISDAAKQGANWFHANVMDFGEVITPFIYFAIAKYNLNLKIGALNNKKKDLLSEYFDGIGQLFKDLYSYLSKIGEKKIEKTKLVVDCANGVGFKTCQFFYESYMKDFLDLRFINTNDVDKLNLNCGAEYVQKERMFPSGFQVDSDINGLSFDGDADRLVFYQNINGKLSLIDGDKQCAFFCLAINKYMKDVYPSLGYTFGAVITQYSNFGMIKFFKEHGISYAISPTGVKNTHKRAEKYDIGIYFETNGHGTLMIKEELYQKMIIIDNSNPENKLNDLKKFVNNVI